MSFEAGYGTVLRLGSTSVVASATYTTVAQVTKIGNLALESVFSEFVQHGGSGFQEKIPTIQKIGSIDLELGFDSSNATQTEGAGGLVNAWINRTRLAYRLLLTDAGALNVRFLAYVGKVDIDPDPEKHIKAKITLEPTGGPTIS